MNLLNKISHSLVGCLFPRIAIARYSLVLVILAFAFFCCPSDLRALTRTEEVWWLPVNVTKDGAQIDALFYFIYYMTFAVFIGTQLTLIYFIIRYRKRENVKAIYSHGNNTLELIWTAIPLVIFILLGFYGNDMWSRMKRQPLPEGPVIEIDVVAQQFDWSMRYAGLDGKFGEADDKLMAADNLFGTKSEDPAGQDDIKITGEMVMPTGVPVRLHLRSRDVIHSFYVPEFRFYQDVVPGKKISWNWFEAFEKGNFQIACSQLCGANHYKMFAKLRVVSREEFDAWIREKSEAQKAERTAQTAQKIESSNSTASLNISLIHP